MDGGGGHGGLGLGSRTLALKKGHQHYRVENAMWCGQMVVRVNACLELGLGGWSSIMWMGATETPLPQQRGSVGGQGQARHLMWTHVLKDQHLGHLHAG